MPAVVTYGFIRSLPLRIRMHAQGFVQSAATVLFLAGQERTVDHNARFLFHPVRASVPGNFNEQQFQDQLAQLADVEASVAQIYRERTRLSDEDIARFQRDTVTLSAQKAQQDGIVSAVGDLMLPGNQQARILFVD